MTIQQQQRIRNCVDGTTHHLLKALTQHLTGKTEKGKECCVRIGGHQADILTQDIPHEAGVPHTQSGHQKFGLEVQKANKKYPCTVHLISSTDIMNTVK
jgi:hypothetical protein